MYCSGCGKELRDDARFCDSCGKNIYVDKGSLRKCAYCGEMIGTIDLFCPCCGKERDITSGAISSVKELVEKLEIIEAEKIRYLIERERAIRSEKNEDDFEDDSATANRLFEEQKINAIKTFPIPTTAEGIFEFMTLASSNFDAEYYARNLRNNDVSDAWLAKIEYAYRKAELLFSGRPEFEVIRNIYQRINEDKKRAIEERKKGFKKIAFAVLAVLCAALTLTIIVLSMVFGKRPVGVSADDFIGQSVNGVVEYLKDQGFTNIIVEEVDESTHGVKPGEVASVSVDGDDDFDKNDKFRKRASIVVLYYDDYISVTTSAKDLKGKNYEDVVEILKNMGFINVRIEEKNDISLGLLFEVGEVASVSINGNDKFKVGQEFKSSDVVIVTYHTKK